MSAQILGRQIPHVARKYTLDVAEKVWLKTLYSYCLYIWHFSNCTSRQVFQSFINAMLKNMHVF